MTTYGISKYGPPNLYGPGRPTTVVPGGPPVPLISNAYLIDPFAATPIDYASILLTWTAPDETTVSPMNEFRLISNRYGFPVDENDGTILLDVTSSPGTKYLDQSVVPGAMHYYAFYILGQDTLGDPLWIRSGFAACLMPSNYGSGDRLLSLLPEYLRDLNDYELTGSFTTPQYVAAPPVPASAYSMTSPYPFPVQVTLTGGTVTDVTSDDVDLGITSQFWVAAGGTVSVTYTGPLSWSWANIPAGNVNPYLQQFLGVAGWSLDYLQTQYDYTFNTLNSPMKMPLDELVRLAGQLGVPFQPEIPAYFMRKAVANWATVMKERGSLAGIAEHISLLTGYGADVQLSRNIMLENDQSNPSNPVYSAWNAGTPYKLGERVVYPVYTEWSDSKTYITGNAVDFDGVYYQFSGSTTTEIPPVINGSLSAGWAIIQGPYIYQCATAVTSLPGTAPTGTNSSNSTWTLVYDVDNGVTTYSSTASYTLGQRVGYQGIEYQCISAASPGNAPTGTNAANTWWQPVYDTLWIPGIIGGTNTWELVYPGSTGTASAAVGSAGYSLVEGVGVPNPVNFANDYTQKTIRAYNKTGSTQDVWVRSVSRQVSDLSVTGLEATWSPDPQLVVEHGIPVPQPGPEWNVQTRYGTGQTVTWQGINYIAMRASTGQQPPSSGFTPEWAPLGPNEGIPLMVSAQASQALSVAANETFAITPFVEWYDAWGNFISRVFSRTPVAGTPGTPDKYIYDGFDTNPGAALAGRGTDAGGVSWSVPVGSWTTDADGNAYPTVAGAQSVAVVSVPASATQAVTFTGTAYSGQDTGLVFWYQSSTQYWHAGSVGLYWFSSGTWTQAATYSHACAPGDRLYVITNNSGSTITMPNGAGTLVSPGIAVFRNGVKPLAGGNGLVAKVAGSPPFGTTIPSGMVPVGSTSQAGIASEAV